jgi:hypothetical protein
MSCPDCRPNGRARLLWFGIAITAVLAFGYLEGAVNEHRAPPTFTSP